MAYDTNSLVTLIPRLGTAEGPGSAAGGYSAGVHMYRSADLVATVIAAGYVDDGNDKGVQVNDVVIVIDDNTPTVDVCLVTVVAANGDVTMINGT